jgi:hypothetical protein
LSLIVTPIIASTWAVERHVSPSGNDGDIGSSDNPLKTFVVAQKAVREADREERIWKAWILHGLVTAGYYFVGTGGG